MAPSAVPRPRLGAMPHQLIRENNRINKKSAVLPRDAYPASARVI